MCATCLGAMMDRFERVESVAAPLPEAEIDTDAIFPARFLLVIEREKYKDFLFAERRNEEEFVLNQPQYANAKIIVGGPRFGIGSSREHAVWALADYGVRCIIAPSFGDIFRANCFKNGVLPIELDDAAHEAVLKAAQEAQTVIVDLETQTVELPNGASIAFSIDPDKRRALLDGLDHVDLIIKDEASIDAFEQAQRNEQPWLYLDIDHLRAVAQQKTK